MKRLPMPLLITTALLLLVGCTTVFEPSRARHQQTESFSATLAARAKIALQKPLSLDDCLRIAMTNNYAVRNAALNQELARLGKNVAFTAFLPHVAASVGYTARDYDNMSGMTSSGDYVLGAKRDSSAALSVAMPVFMPSTWFLYAAARHGYAAASVASFYTRQSIVLQTTVDYCNVLVQQDTIRALETQLSAAEKFADRLAGLAEEGYITPWERGQADMQTLARKTELDSARRQLAILNGKLLQGLGLPPHAPLRLSGDLGESHTPKGNLDDLVLQALATHPQLSLADRQVVMKEHAARQAFCDFLPTLSLNATHAWGGENFALDAIGWSTGFQGAWHLFTGLANLARYRAARVETQQSELERENTFLSVIVGVIAAEAQVHDATEAVALRQKMYDVYAAKYDDYAARANEGLKPISDALDARAEMDLAQVALVRSRYQAKVAIANLELAMGITLLPQDPPPPPTPATPPNKKIKPKPKAKPKPEKNTATIPAAPNKKKTK